VQFRKAPHTGDFDKIDRKGGIRRKNFAATKAAAYEISADQVASVAADPNVAYVSLDRPVRPTLNVAAASTGADLALNTGFDGRGIGIAIIDSGVKDGADDLKYDGKSRVVYKESFLDTTKDPKDEYGHGTHVAGVAAGNGRKSTGSDFKATLRGIAPRAHIISLRVLDGKGAGKDSDVIDAIERAIQLRAQWNIRVINLSLGRPVWESYETDPLCTPRATMAG
jgi:serine protease AprX